MTTKSFDIGSFNSGLFIINTQYYGASNSNGIQANVTINTAIAIIPNINRQSFPTPNYDSTTYRSYWDDNVCFMWGTTDTQLNLIYGTGSTSVGGYF